MLVEDSCALIRFPEIEYGRPVVAVARDNAVAPNDNKVVRGMKAFVAGEDGDSTDYFVTLGPFLAHGADGPEMWEPKDFREYVLDVGNPCRLSPSWAAVDVFSELPPSTECCGTLFKTEERLLLGVRHDFRAETRLPIAFLDVSSGEILFDAVQHDRAIATRRWSLIEVLDEPYTTTTLFEFTSKQSVNATP